MSESTPNPGSDEALARGCTCAVLDNNHGRRAPRPPDGWWITGGCPVHAPERPIDIADVYQIAAEVRDGRFGRPRYGSRLDMSFTDVIGTAELAIAAYKGLCEYGVHHLKCPAGEWYPSHDTARPECTCGLDALLARLRGDDGE